MATPTPTRQTVRFGDFEASLRSGELRRNGLKVKLRGQSFQVLALLLDSPGEMVTREELRQKLWQEDTFVDFEAGLNSAIKRLRDALCDSAEEPRFIETLPRRGYRFIASVETIAAVPPPALVPTSSTAEVDVVAASELAASVDGTALPASKARFTRFWLAAGIPVGLAVLLFGLNVGRVRERALGRPAVPPIKSIAVLPFDNLTGDPAQEYLVDGMTDELTTRLAQITSWKVISRTSAMQYKGVKKPLPQIARDLSVDAVVEGSVARSGRRIRVTAQLLQATTDRHLWADSYERDLGDILALQGEVARDITDRVRIRLNSREEERLAQAKPVDPEAYENYLKGLYYLQKWTSEDSNRSIEYFQKTIQRDPNYAAAYAGLAAGYWRMAFLSPVQPRDAFGSAEAAARKALELDELLGEAHALLAAIKYRYHWDWPGADAEFRRALELSPNSAEIHREHSVYLEAANRYQESVDEAKRNQELDPVSPRLGAALLIARRYDQAVLELRKNIALNPEAVRPHHFLGIAYEQQNKAPEAIAELEQAVSLSHRDPIFLAGLAHAYAVFGKRQQAKAILAELEQRSQREYVPPYHFALVWLGLGNKEQALAWLEKAYVDRPIPLVTINSWPWFDPLRSDPRFQSLVRRIGLDPRRAIPN